MIEKTSSNRIMIVTGEASGDLHGASLIRAVKARSPETSFFGVGGNGMSAAGCEILIPGEKLAVMGIVEVFGHFPVIWDSFQKLKKILQNEKPAALVLIDFPEFNLRLARQAKLVGVPVLYYVSPQVWAWRRGRVRKIAAVVDSLAAIFPFEPEFYRGLDIHVEYVGHPLLDEFQSVLLSQKADQDDQSSELQLPVGKKIVGIFPGSRRNELRYMLETLVETAKLIHDGCPDVHFLVPIAESLEEVEVTSGFDTSLPVTFVNPASVDIYRVARRCETILTVSGTVTLQIALAGTPMAILYKLAPFSYAIGKRLVRVDHIGLANIVAEKRVVPEFVQDAATPDVLAAEILKQIEDHDYTATMKAELKTIQQKLGKPGCSARVAEMLLNLTSPKAH